MNYFICRKNLLDQIPDDKVCILTYLDYDMPNDRIENMIGLAIFSAPVQFQSEHVPCSEDQDPAQEVWKMLTNILLDRTLALSAEAKSKWPMKDLHVSLGDGRIYRKLIARTFSAANFIMANGRRGPANFAIVASDVMPFMLNVDMPLQQMDSMLPEGITWMTSNRISNKIVIGRMPKSAHEPGLHLLGTEQSLNGEITSDEQGITGANVTYAIAALGIDPSSVYMEFDVIWNNEI